MIDIKIEKEELRNIIKKLENLNKKAPSAVANAVNKTAREARKTLLNEAKSKYTLQRKRFGQNSSIERASASNLEAKIRFKGKNNPFTYFKTKPKGPKKARRGAAGANVEIKAGHTVGFNRTGYKGFIVNFKSGHTAFVVRLPGTRMRKKNKEQLKEYYSLSVPSMIKRNVEDNSGTLTLIQESLKKHVDAQIEKLLGGAK